MRREWTWRVGAQAAEHYVRVGKYQIAAVTAFIPALLLFNAGLYFHSPALLLVSIAPYLAMFTCIVMSGVELRRLHNISCDALQLPRKSRAVRFPGRNSMYLVFCRRYHLQPYPFKPRDGMQDHASEAEHR